VELHLSPAEGEQVEITRQRQGEEGLLGRAEVLRLLRGCVISNAYGETILHGLVPGKKVPGALLRRSSQCPEEQIPAEKNGSNRRAPGKQVFFLTQN
jgi:hypothetical protein